MLDPVAQGLTAVSTRSAYAAPLVFLAGAASSIGPCVAPRFIAIAGMTAGKSSFQTAVLAAAFVCGLTATYAAFGAVSPLLAGAAQWSQLTYAIVALTLAAGGLVTLWRGETACAHDHTNRSRSSAGAAFLLGTSFALVVSPCCTPLVVGILAYTSASGSAAYGSALLASFALGHALPVFVSAFGAHSIAQTLRRYSVRQAASVVSATLMLGLAGYYALLA